MPRPDSTRPATPNVVLVYFDDMGWGDMPGFSVSDEDRPAYTREMPNFARLAREGTAFRRFYTAQPVCSASRAALLTGCYPNRIGISGALFPDAKVGIAAEERTLAEVLRAQGYATLIAGKWHLGHLPEFNPMHHGFDEYLGIPYSNDMNHPDNQGKPKSGPVGMDELWLEPASTLTKWKTPLMENERIVELPVDQRTITRRCTDRAIDFIEKNQKRPFFVYLPYSMPHIPLYVPDDVRDPDPTRAYINTIEHLDTEVGRIFDRLRDLNLAANTYVIFTTDNGPWLTFKHHGGSAGPLRDGKMSTFEGGQRVPCIMWAPGRIPANSVCESLASTIDLLPTIAALTGTPLPANRTIDGLDISGLLTGTVKSVRNEFLYYSRDGTLEGLREGDWKFIEPRPAAANKAKAALKPEVMLFNLASDLGETRNLAAEKPELVERLRRRMVELDAAIGAGARPVWKKSGS